MAEAAGCCGSGDSGAPGASGLQSRMYSAINKAHPTISHIRGGWVAMVLPHTCLNAREVSRRTARADTNKTKTKSTCA